jgi:hypothetical protein
MPVAERRAARLHQIESSLGGIDDDRARRVIAGIINAGAWNGTDANADATVASVVAGPAIQEVEVSLRLRRTRTG